MSLCECRYYAAGNLNKKKKKKKKVKSLRIEQFITVIKSSVRVFSEHSKRLSPHADTPVGFWAVSERPLKASELADNLKFITFWARGPTANIKVTNFNRCLKGSKS